MLPTVVTYALNDSTKVRFEIDPPAGFQEAGADRVIGKVQDALAPAIETANLVIDKLKEAKPGGITVSFGLKVSGKLDWFVARAGTEGNFQITLTWQPGETEGANLLRPEEPGRWVTADGPEREDGLDLLG